MHETNTCRHCHTQITRYRSGWWSWNGGTRKSSNYCPDGWKQHAPVGDGPDGRPVGPYLLHLGLHNWRDRTDAIPAADLGPDFATDGDSWNQWCEPYDGTQRVTVRLDEMPDDPEEHARETARALKALVGIRDLGVGVSGSVCYTSAEGDWSEWEVVVKTCDV